MNKTKFKVGDRVMVKKSVKEPYYGWGGATHEDVGAITRMTDKVIFVNFPESKVWQARPSELELIKKTRSKSSSVSIELYVKCFGLEFLVNDFLPVMNSYVKAKESFHDQISISIKGIFVPIEDAKQAISDFKAKIAKISKGK